MRLNVSNILAAHLECDLNKTDRGQCSGSNEAGGWCTIWKVLNLG